LILAFVNNAKISVTKDTSICQLGVLQLNVAGAESYKWSPSSGLNNPDIPNPVATVNGSIKYRVTGTTISGCMVTDSVQINELPLPIVSTYADRTLVCGIFDVQLTSVGGVKYEWSPSSGLNNPNIRNPIAKVESLQIYKVKITGVNGCFTNDSVTISWKEKPVYGISPVTATVCSKDTLSIQVIGGDKFLWEPAQYLNTNSGSRVIAQPISDTDFRVKVWDTQCNDSTVLTSIIKVNPGPSIAVTKSNDITCDVVTTQLNANGAISYQWQPANGLNAANIANPVARPTATITYNVTAKDGIGCTSIDSVTVFFNAIGDGRLYQMPTAFTPNGDGLNDCFGISKWGANVEIEVFDIYNRWGERVFTASPQNQCWDGNFKGKPQTKGNFFYILKVRSACGDIDKKGSFLLIR
jgi:gliding motility-associated-like protein